MSEKKSERKINNIPANNHYLKNPKNRLSSHLNPDMESKSAINSSVNINITEDMHSELNFREETLKSSIISGSIGI